MALNFCKFFETHTEYNNYVSNVLNTSTGESFKDNFSYCVDNDHIHYNGKLAVKMTSLESGDDTVLTIPSRKLTNHILTMDDMKAAGIPLYMIMGNNQNDFIAHPEKYKRAKIEVYDTVTSIYNSYDWTIDPGPFLWNMSIEELIIPDSIVNIPMSMCINAFGLKKLILGKNVATIGMEAFDSCELLEILICYAEQPPLLESFALPIDADFNIYVPEDSVDTYKAASGWSSHASRIQAIPEP